MPCLEVDLCAGESKSGRDREYSEDQAKVPRLAYEDPNVLDAEVSEFLV